MGARGPKPQPITERYVITESGCWEFTGYIDHHGYGEISIDGRKRRAHRVSYEFFVGPIPEGLTLDHLCRNTRCINPEHLEPVTGGENNRRSMNPRMVAHRENRCVRGHPFTPENTRWQDGRRGCRTCIAAWKRSHQPNHPANRRTATQ